MNELSAEFRHMLKVQWGEFVRILDDVDESRIVGGIDPAVLMMLERAFIASSG